MTDVARTILSGWEFSNRKKGGSDNGSPGASVPVSLVWPFPMIAGFHLLRSPSLFFHLCNSECEIIKSCVWKFGLLWRLKMRVRERERYWSGPGFAGATSASFLYARRMNLRGRWFVMNCVIYSRALSCRLIDWIHLNSDQCVLKMCRAVNSVARRILRSKISFSATKTVDISSFFFPS